MAGHSHQGREKTTDKSPVSTADLLPQYTQLLHGEASRIKKDFKELKQLSVDNP